MTMTKNARHSELCGWVQECKACGHVSKYDQYLSECADCHSTERTIYFICPSCAATTPFGETKCQGCKKDISYLIRERFILKEKKEERRVRRRHLLVSILVAIVFGVMLYFAGLSWPFASALGVGTGLFAYFVK